MKNKYSIDKVDRFRNYAIAQLINEIDLQLKIHKDMYNKLRRQDRKNKTLETIDELRCIRNFITHIGNKNIDKTLRRELFMNLDPNINYSGFFRYLHCIIIQSKQRFRK
jgi:hypothetical protein